MKKSYFFYKKKLDFLFLTGNEVGQMRLGGTHVLVRADFCLSFINLIFVNFSVFLSFIHIIRRLHKQLQVILTTF